MSDTASKEFSLEKALDKMLKEWQPMAFDCMEYRDTGTYILRALDDIQSSSTTTSSRRRRCAVALRQALRAALPRLGEEADLDAGDHRRVAQVPVGVALPGADLLVRGHHAADAAGGEALHAGRPPLAQGDGADRAEAERAHGDRAEGMHESFQNANHLLELIQQGLNDASRRSASFARLFFLSNDELCKSSPRPRTRCACSRT